MGGDEQLIPKVPILQQRRPGGKIRVRYEQRPLLENTDAEDRVPPEVIRRVFERLSISNALAAHNAGIDKETVHRFKLPSDHRRYRGARTGIFLRMVGKPVSSWGLSDADRAYLCQHANLKLSLAFGSSMYPLAWPESD